MGGGRHIACAPLVARFGKASQPVRQGITVPTAADRASSSAAPPSFQWMWADAGPPAAMRSISYADSNPLRWSPLIPPRELAAQLNSRREENRPVSVRQAGQGIARTFQNAHAAA